MSVSPRRAYQERLLGRAGSDGRGGVLACPLRLTLPKEGRSYNACQGTLQSFQRVMFCSGVIEGSVAGPGEVLEKDPSPVSDR